MDTLTTQQNKGFAYRRPRHPVKALKRLIRHLIRRVRRNSRRIARITAQAIISGAFVAVGIIAGLTIVGLLCGLCGICLMSAQPAESDEEYRQMVIEHFQARGQTPPRWTRREVRSE